MNSIDIDSRNLCLLNFFDILTECENKILDDLYKFDLLDDLSYQKIDVKRIIYYYIILHLCEAVIHRMTFNKIVVIYSEKDIDRTSLCKYCSKFRTASFLKNTLLKIGRLLPLRIYTSSESFDELKYILDHGNGERTETLARIQSCIGKRQVNTFQNIKQFVKKYELTFLSEEFFHRVKTKNLMFL